MTKSNHKEYVKWLNWYVENGGHVTHMYNYPSNGWGWVVAKQGGRYSGGYGADSINLIIPEHVTEYTLEEAGHSSVFVYDMEAMKASQVRVPQFSDCAENV